MTDYNIYTNKDGRTRVYNKETHSVTSYPRLIMEEHLGRKLLKTEDVHHIDGNPLNNDVTNLQVILHSEHDKMHAGGNRKYYPKKMICPVCKNEFIWNERDQCRFVTRNNKTGPFCSRHCSGIYFSKNLKYTERS